jgi:hypothetical protein
VVILPKLRKNKILLFPKKTNYVLESSFEALSESVKIFGDFALIHRKQAAKIKHFFRVPYEIMKKKKTSLEIYS